VSTRLANVDALRSGPWALVTGASSGIGREFARQLSASGISVVLVARREGPMREAGQEFTRTYGVNHRVVSLDLTKPHAVHQLGVATNDLDLGLVVANAGTAVPGEFLSHDIDVLRDVMSLNAMSPLEVAHHFGRRLARRGHGGIVLVSAAGSRHGVPNMANDAATKAYVLALGQGLHTELGRRGVDLTVLLPGATDTPVLERFGVKPGSTLVKPMSVDQCVAEGLRALSVHKATCIPGTVNRVFDRVVPGRVTSMMMGRMAGQWGEHIAAHKADVMGDV
jgi:short-subunit dehydrogenase